MALSQLVDLYLKECIWDSPTEVAFVEGCPHVSGVTFMRGSTIVNSFTNVKFSVEQQRENVPRITVIASMMSRLIAVAETERPLNSLLQLNFVNTCACIVN